MKTESEQVQRWDDIIFENRNKAYGAYAIRKSYGDNVLTGWAMSLGIASLIFTFSFLSNEEVNTPPTYTDSGGGLIPPPHVKPDVKANQEPPAPKQFKKDLFPIATTKKDINDIKPVEPTTPENPGGANNGNIGDGNPQPGTDIGTIANPEPPKAPPFVLYAEHMPAYEGGDEAMMKFLQKKMRYPRAAERKRDEGTVYVSFIISSTGTVTHVEIIKGFNKECDQEAVRVISMMNKWKPGLHNKMPVAVKLVLPIKFKLNS